MEKDRGFSDLNARESGEVFPAIIDNAERHFAVAHQIATINEYPNAVVHLILGAEELVKATLMILKSREVDVRETIGYDMLSVSKKSGRPMLKDFFAVWIGIREILKVPRSKQTFSLKYLFNLVISEFVGIVKGKDNFNWWERVDALKEKCMYVGFENGLVLPDLQVSKSEYHQAHHHVYSFRYEFYLMQHKVLNASRMELAELREQLDNTEIAALLEQTFLRSRPAG